MFDPETIQELKNAIADCIGADQGILHTLRAEIKPLRGATHRIQPRAITSISVVGNRAKQGLPSSSEPMTLFWDGSLRLGRTSACHIMKSLK
jgi:hypothetical protein